MLVLMMMNIPVSFGEEGSSNYLEFFHEETALLDIQTYDKLYDIYTFRYRVDDRGRPLTIIHMPKYSFEFRSLVKDILGLPINNYIDRMNTVMTNGVGLKVKIARTSSDMIQMVTNTPVSIGYVENVIYINGGEDVKTINVCDFLTCR